MVKSPGNLCSRSLKSPGKEFLKMNHVSRCIRSKQDCGKEFPKIRMNHVSRCIHSRQDCFSVHSYTPCKRQHGI